MCSTTRFWVTPGVTEAKSSLRSTWPIHRREALQLTGAGLVITAIWTGIGFSITGPLEESWIVHNDERISAEYVERRTSTWNTLSKWGSGLPETWVKVLITAIVALILLRVLRRWFESLVIVVSLVMEASAFIIVTTIVGRHRPEIARLDESPVNSSFPSGHVAAAVAYAAFTVVLFWHVRNRSVRAIAILITVAVPIIVAFARVYRGMHYVSDVTFGALLGGACVWATVAIMRGSPERPADLAGSEPKPEIDRTPASTSIG